MMKFSDVAPIIEGKLHAYGLMRIEYPSVQIASYNKQDGRVETPDTTSPQEEWAARFGLELQELKVIEDTLKKLSDAQRTLVRMRYIHKERWRVIAKAIHVSEKHVYKERDAVLAVFAYAFGMMDKNGGVA